MLSINRKSGSTKKTKLNENNFQLKRLIQMESMIFIYFEKEKIFTTSKLTTKAKMFFNSVKSESWDKKMLRKQINFEKQKLESGSRTLFCELWVSANLKVPHPFWMLSWSCWDAWKSKDWSQAQHNCQRWRFTRLLVLYMSAHSRSLSLKRERERERTKQRLKIVGILFQLLLVPRDISQHSNHRQS